ncbi:related to Beta-mannosidase precursor [Sporisorium reilianum SRZ2]|uniref:Beta-mannosidase A n=1 Tax=Sporisorium reilianum (strain SRZ2) TaxID=999809 RepID=E6ZYX3_SPORE|nr:related to Beta-mannosidase precursor [Sporisorium reilianum SRZ2]
MTKCLLVIGLLIARAAVVIAWQQPWHLPFDASAAQSIPEHHPAFISSSNARIWSLSSTESHRQPFPSHSAPAAASAATGFAASAAPASLQWSLSNANGSICVDALFPSLAHLDLLRAGVINDPHVGLNEGLYWWISNEPAWTYTASLEPILAQLRAAENRQYWLYFQGLDTIAQVYVGGQLISETHNYHQWYAFQVPTHLLERNATMAVNITLVFQNVNEYAAKRAAQFGPGYPTQLDSADRPRVFDYEFPNRIQVRKQQSDLGWDWGPALVPVGPYKPAYLIALPGSAQESQDAVAVKRVDDDGDDAADKPAVLVLASGIDIYRKGQTNNLPPPDPDANWIVNVTLTLLSATDIEHPSLRLAIPALELYTFDVLLSAPMVSAGLNTPIYATFEVPSGGVHGPSLWWPRGYGNQTLYDVVLRSDELAIVVNKRVGFRTAVFDLSTVSAEDVAQGVQPGSWFRLHVNARDVYVMGTNMIPLDTLSPRTNAAYLRWLLDSALHTHVNLIRVWGGGAYPSAEFLELCDELGVMVWMDAMFAASLYPYDGGFVEAVRAEVAQVMVDVVGHASVVVVVGNNEGELFFLGGYGEWERDAEWKSGYEELFDRVVRDGVREASRALSYIPCSTTTGYVQLEPYVGRYANYTRGELHGTGEHYGYNATRAFDIATYPRSRFMVEFGMFSLPSIYALDAILDGGDYSVNSSVLRAHLKHPPAGNLTYPFRAAQGQAELLSAIALYLPTPSVRLSARAQLHRYAVSSQLYHALYVAHQIGVYRRGAAARERNRGLVVWQLNDVWPGTSWSSIEYGGRWKVVQYALVDVQAPVAAVAVYDEREDVLDVVVVWSGADVRRNVTVRIEWFDFTGTPLAIDEKHIPITTAHPGSATAHTIPHPSTTYTTAAYVRLTLPTTRSTVYWTPPHTLASTLHHLHAKRTAPRLELHPTPAGTARVRNTGTAVAPYVWLEAREPGFFATCAQGTCRPSNAFWLNPGDEVEVHFVRASGAAERDGDGEERERWWMHNVTVSSLFDNLAPL